MYTFISRQCQKQKQIPLWSFPGFYRFVPFVDGMLSTAFSSPAHGDGRDSKTDGDVGVCAGGTDVQGFHAYGLICSICSLDNLAGFVLGTSGAPALLFEGDCNAVIFCWGFPVSIISIHWHCASCISHTAFRCHIIVVKGSCTLRT